jgi:hypothetical protein
LSDEVWDKDLFFRAANCAERCARDDVFRLLTSCFENPPAAAGGLPGWRSLKFIGASFVYYAILLTVV